MPLGVVGDLEQLERPLAGDRLVVERLGLEARLDRVAGAVVAAIDPGVDGERLAGHQHVARADDGAARLVGDLGRDLVPLVLVGMSLLGQRGVDLDGQRAVGPDRHLGLGHDFGRALRRCPTTRARAGACPSATSRDTRSSRRRTTSSRGRRASPTGRGIPAVVGRRPGDLVLDLGLGDRRAEVVLRLDGRRHLLAQHHRLVRGLDAHLELGLLVLLDPERAAAMVGDEDLVNSERRVRGQLERAVEAAEGVGLEVPGEDLLALGILDLDREGLAGEVGGVRLVVAGVRDPELEPDRLPGR